MALNVHWTNGHSNSDSQACLYTSYILDTYRDTLMASCCNMICGFLCTLQSAVKRCYYGHHENASRIDAQTEFIVHLSHYTEPKFWPGRVSSLNNFELH